MSFTYSPLAYFIKNWLDTKTTFCDDDTAFNLRVIEERIRRELVETSFVTTQLQRAARTLYAMHRARIEDFPLFRKRFSLQMNLEIAYELHNPRFAVDGDIEEYARDLRAVIERMLIRNLEMDMEGSVNVGANSVRYNKQKKNAESGRAILRFYESLADLDSAKLGREHLFYGPVAYALNDAVHALEMTGEDVLRFVHYVQKLKGVPRGQ